MRTVRAGAGIGLAIATVVALWWLALMYPAPARAGGAAGTAAQAATALWLVRAVALMVIASRLGVLLDPRPAFYAAAAVIAVAWPLLVMLWAAGGMLAGTILGSEAMLLVLTASCIGCGRVLARLPCSREAALAMATAAGCLGAALLLVFRGDYLSWIGWAA